MTINLIRADISRWVFAILVILISPMALAQSLDEAKSSGLIGEKSDGYIGFVQESPPAALVALVNDVNRQRRARYAEIARQNNIGIGEVAQLAYLRAVEATKPGHFIEDADGRWVRKP
ncbi:YdbL family protein [Pseudohongiella spirulinae]|uniref:Uncharacterized conserved protein UCP025560 n=1 Tax=Pseudohongiella spirulinae TaxID=1249552 RepID=A0A0S2KFR3_9GAMM|nr:YdbL family protein [Pseudohongiella spirulinae]ALO46942.1 Uncharacterized conserved protein UCP025560 [Pseudohongiella spirulinae]